MSNRDNLVIYMADTVRRDFFPVFDSGVTVDAVAEGRNTPQSFPGILSGMGAAKHEVTWFNQTVQRPTVLNLDQMGYVTAYWDHPDSPMYRVFGHRNRKRFGETVDAAEEADTNFVWVRRDTVSHLPYGHSWEEGETMGEDAEQMSRAVEYADLFRVVSAIKDGDKELHWDDVPEKGQGYMEDRDEYSEWQKEQLKRKFPYKDQYMDGVQKSKEKFLEVVEEAKDKGVYEDTLFVYCTDHGEAFPEDRRNAFGHSLPTREVIDVKVHFENVDYEEDIKEHLFFGELQLKDIVRVWNNNWDMIKGGLEVRNSRKPDEAEEEIDF